MCFFKNITIRLKTTKHQQKLESYFQSAQGNNGTMCFGEFYINYHLDLKGKQNSFNFPHQLFILNNFKFSAKSQGSVMNMVYGLPRITIHFSTFDFLFAVRFIYLFPYRILSYWNLSHTAEHSTPNSFCVFILVTKIFSFKAIIR